MYNWHDGRQQIPISNKGNRGGKVTLQIPDARFPIILLAILLFALTGSAWSAAGSNEENGQYRFIAMPYLAGGSDEGLEIGITSGLARYPDMMIYAIGSWSTKGYTSLGVRGEKNAGSYRLIGKAYITSIKRYLYHDETGVPEPYASAAVRRLEVKLAALRKVRANLELGPEMICEIADGKDVEDAYGQPASIDSLPRFGYGSIAQIGIRARYRTTSSMRPLNGLIMDGSVRLGRADSDVLDNPSLDFGCDLWAAAARPFNPRTRLYLRGWWGYQHRTSPPNRLAIGGKWTLRGQPDQRDFGRRTINGRAQLHYLVIPEWSLPLETLHNLWSVIPDYRIDLETVAFLDIGRVGDPDYGWRKTRCGCGGGLRFVFPPEMVFFFDIAGSSGGGMRFYIGVGETL